MERHTLDNVKQVWQTWDIRAFMLTSLLIQILLTSLAPYRKRCASGFLSFSMWLLYLGADAVALFTIGLISSAPQDATTGSGGPVQKPELLAFWAPFLLLHLGGPDTITALALEDNELWHRHALQLITQVAVTLYVFAQTFRTNHNLLMVLASAFMFIDGCVKYYERTCALYFASMENFRHSQRTKPEPGPNYARFMEEYSSAASANIPTEIQGKDGPNNNNKRIAQLRRSHDQPTGHPTTTTATAAAAQAVEKTDEILVKDAHWFYHKFKGLLADSFLSLKDRDESRTFFLNKEGREAFRIVEIELNLMYDVFYTKVFLLNRKRGYARFLCFLSVIASLLLFCFKDKSNYNRVDVGITFALLGGAIALDTTTIAILLLSDWWIIITNNWDDRPRCLKSLLQCMLQWLRWARDLGRKRWSQSLSKYSLIKCCLKDPPSFFDHIYIKRIQDAFVNWLYLDSSEVDDRLVNFVIQELQTKAKLATDVNTAKEICSARGSLVSEEDYLFVSEYLRPWTIDVDYDESLLTWHLATDICYWTTNDGEDDEEDVKNMKSFRKLCKELSDYMSYLLLRQQALVSSVVGMSDIRFQDTCEEAKKFTDVRLDSWVEDVCSKAKDLLFKILRFQKLAQSERLREEREAARLGEFCVKLLKVKTDIQPIVAKGDKSKSVLFDACRLAKQLKMLGGCQWEIMSKVWVELLCYAAIRCSPRSHVAQLSKGGELITLVWLLMVHFGLGERFRQNQGFGWTKLVIHK